MQHHGDIAPHLLEHGNWSAAGRHEVLAGGLDPIDRWPAFEKAAEVFRPQADPMA
jgi:hypothetical protein